jgi:glyoxylase-like metal-dependent hydrolase (beta-lactamase superfamily II)
MKRSLNRIKTMDKRLVVHPGHGETTTLENELKTNPFLKQ